MGFFPIVMNVIQFWIIDSIVKATTSAIPVISSSPEDEEERSPFIGENEHSEDRSDGTLAEDLESGVIKTGATSTPTEQKSIASASTRSVS
jgi:hypothetical protein